MRGTPARGFARCVLALSILLISVELGWGGGTGPERQGSTGGRRIGVTGVAADLSITKTDGAATAIPGDTLSYTIVVSNATATPASGATVADPFPATLTCTWICIGAGGGTCTAAGSGNINDSANLPAGASVTYTADCTLSAAATGTLSNSATVALAGDPNPANNSATDVDTLTPKFDLGITNSDGVTMATPGGSVTYTIVASNAGPSNAPSATVSDTFPASCTSFNYTSVAAGGAAGNTAAGSGNISDVVSLPVGSSITYSATCAISGAATGTLTNVAKLRANLGNNILDSPEGRA